MTAASIPRQEISPGSLSERIERRLERWRRDGFVARLRRRDPAVWGDGAGLMGWLELPESMPGRLPELRALAGRFGGGAVRDVFLLGMGGSSLGAEVFARVLGGSGVDGERPRLTVVDTTHPTAVARHADSFEPEKSLVLVASKSGGTAETMALFELFWDRAASAVDAPGGRFVAIAGAGSGLERLAAERGFTASVEAPPDVGGRYSALSAFGLLPAVLLGLDAEELLAGARAVAATVAGDEPGPALELGAALGELALAGRDKLTLVPEAPLGPFCAWLEQLVAESTGKRGRGILPVVGEPLGDPASYGPDRVFVGIRLEGAPEPAAERMLEAAERAGHPVVRLVLGSPIDLGAEMYRWQIAVAGAAAVLGVTPFDQPDVEAAKQAARQALAEPPDAAARSAALAVDDPGLARALARWRAGAGPRGYFAVQAFLAPAPRIDALLGRLQGALRDVTGLAATAGYGPRYLHSTGQLHKGGAEGGAFLQLVDRPGRDLEVPGSGYSFGRLLAAQARGDAEALASRGRPVLAVDLGADPEAGLERLLGALAAP